MLQPSKITLASAQISGAELAEKMTDSLQENSAQHPRLGTVTAMNLSGRKENSHNLKHNYEAKAVIISHRFTLPRNRR